MIFHKPVLIAEIGCNHKGKLSIAKDMIKEASNCGVDYVKFQKRDNRLLLGKDFDKPHPVAENSYGKTYGLHREYLEFSFDQHLSLIKHCKLNRVKYAVSVWDVNSAKEFCKKKYKLDYIKVPSACNNNFELLKILRDKFKGKVHISTGMTYRNEIKKIYDFFKRMKKNRKLVFYACTSDYPVKNEDICLLELQNLKKKYKDIFGIAFSGHHLGIAIDNIAYVLGANYIERHFTLDRTWKGTDHAASLEPQGLSKLSRDLIVSFKSLRFKNKSGLLDCEKIQRKKLKNIFL